MIPKADNTQFQLEVLSKVRSVYEEESNLDDRVLMNAVFANFRTGAGMRLSTFGKDLCIKHNLYEFTRIELPRDLQKSILFTSLDRICSTPYYVEGYSVLISDAVVITELTFCDDDFQRLFDIYL